MLMKTKFEQAELDKWPSGDGRAIAVLRVEPAELASRYGITFVESIDDLDRYSESVIRLSSGRRLLLLRYRGNPSPGTEVHADAADDPIEAQDELLAALALSADAFSWVVPQEGGESNAAP
jgi:hypothetical protein